MVSGRFLFVTFDGGGNTAPTYPLARRLVARQNGRETALKELEALLG